MRHHEALTARARRAVLHEIATVLEVAVAVEKTSVFDSTEYKGDQKYIESLTASMMTLVECEKRIDAADKARGDVLRLKDSQPEADVGTQAEVFRESVRASLARRTEQVNEPRFRQLVDAVRVVNHGHLAAPWSEEVVVDPTDPSDEHQFKCPLTQQVMRSPLISVHCRHAFDADAIRGYLVDEGGLPVPRECPMAGCSVVIAPDVDLQEDPEVQVRLERFVSRQEESQRLRKQYRSMESLEAAGEPPGRRPRLS